MSSIVTENDETFEVVTVDDITKALNTLNLKDNTFAILEREDGSIIQVAKDGKNDFYIQKQTIDSKNMARGTTVNNLDVVSICS